MILARSRDEAEELLRVEADVPAGSVNYFGSSTRLARGPQGFLVRLEGRRVLDPHWHAVDQFQVIMTGSATLGRHKIRPWAIHYVDAYVPYGPIECDAQGLSFFTLRPRADFGIHYMPAEADRLPRRVAPGRYITEPTRLCLDDRASRTTVLSLVPLASDGLLIREILAAPGVPLDDDIVRGSGRFDVVLEGSLLLGARELPPDSCVWAGPGEQVAGRRAGARGVHFLELQAPSS